MNAEMDSVRTLQQAHELLARQWPGRSASSATWRAHHEYAAKLYAHVAEVDQDHHHEALFWAAQEQEAAHGLAETTDSSVAVTPGDGGGDD
jgi:hypothetical protein